MNSLAPADHDPSKARRLLTWGSRLLIFVALASFVWGYQAAEDQVSNPSESLPDHADAVVVFFGGEDRAPAAAELMTTGVADTLVINHGLKNGQLAEALSPLCADPTLVYAVVCIAAEPSNTIGEARAFAQLAEDRGWSALIAFTSDFHLTRAQLHLERCFDGVVGGRAVRSDNDNNNRRETGKLLMAWTIRSGC